MRIRAYGSNPAGVVYGILTVGAVLAAESTRQETFRKTFEAAGTALVLYWLAHTYATIVGRRFGGTEPLSAGLVLRTLVHEWAIVRGASVPLVAVGVAWAAGAGLGTAVTVSLLASALALFGLEAVASSRRGSGRTRVIGEGLVGASLGAAVLLLRFILH